MTIYRYDTPKLIQEITVRQSDKGTKTAYLHASEMADPSQLANLRTSLFKQGWQAVPYLLHGRPSLEIRGFKKEKDLFAGLTSAGAVSGAAQIIPEPDDKISLKDKFRKRTLQAAGYVYFAGDAAFAYYGYSGGRWQNFVAGVFYFLGSLSLAVFGKTENTQSQVCEGAKKLNGFLKSIDAAPTEETALHQVIKHEKTGIKESMLAFCRKYPSEIMNMMFAVAGVFIMTASRHDFKDAAKTKELAKAAEALGKTEVAQSLMNQSRNTKIAGFLDIGLGSMTALSGLVASFVKEKHPDPEDKKKTGIARVWQWVQEKPLRVAGYGYIVSTLCHTGSTALTSRTTGKLDALAKSEIKTLDGAAYSGTNAEHAKVLRDKLIGAQDDYKQLKQSVPFRGVFVGANLASETLLALSSKGHGEGGVGVSNEMRRSMVGLAADALAHSSNVNAAKVEAVAAYLADPNVMGGDASALKESILKQLSATQNNPWNKLTAIQAKLPPETENTPVVGPARSAAIAAALDKKSTAPWAEKSAAPVNAQLSL